MIHRRCLLVRVMHVGLFANVHAAVQARVSRVCLRCLSLSNNRGMIQRQIYQADNVYVVDLDCGIRRLKRSVGSFGERASESSFRRYDSQSPASAFAGSRIRIFFEFENKVLLFVHSVTNCLETIEKGHTPGPQTRSSRDFVEELRKANLQS